MPPTGKWSELGDSMIAGGYSNAEIARELGVATSTVLYHRQRLGEAPAQHPGTQPQRGQTARSRSIRLTDDEVEAFERKADGKGWREWMRTECRKLAGLG